MSDSDQQQQYNVQNDEDDQSYDDDDEDVREQIARFPAHESFDVSSFTESKSGPDILSRHIKGNFPISNAPTLEVSPQPKLNFLSSNPTTITAANIHQFNEKNNKKLKAHHKQKIEHVHEVSQISKMSNLSQINDILKKQIIELQRRQKSYLANIQELNSTNLELERVIRQKDVVIREKQEMLLMQDRKFKENVAQSLAKAQPIQSQQKQKTSQTSYLDEFCPQFLSPEQSLQLFTQLITKLQKSTSMKKRMLKDRKIVGILGQFFKTQ